MTDTIKKYTQSKSRIRRYSTLANAIEFTKNARYGRMTPIILGDDGKFWFCSSPKWAYRLISAGYDEA